MFSGTQPAVARGDEWKVGKDARTIAYIEEGEARLASSPMAKFAFDIEITMDAARAQLRVELDELKSGQMTLDEYLTHKFFTEIPPEFQQR